MAEVIFLQRELLSRLLKDAAATIFVATAFPGVEGFEGMSQVGPGIVMLHVGKNLALPAPVFFFERHLLAQVVVAGHRREVKIPYQAILRTTRFVPPPDGGRKIRNAA